MVSLVPFDKQSEKKVDVTFPDSIENIENKKPKNQIPIANLRVNGIADTAAGEEINDVLHHEGDISNLA